jgi:hypothetical protein
MTSTTENKNIATRIGSEDVPVRELLTYYPVFWFLLPEGPERDALKREQETPGYKPFKR